MRCRHSAEMYIPKIGILDKFPEQIGMLDILCAKIQVGIRMKILGHDDDDDDFNLFKVQPLGQLQGPKPRPPQADPATSRSLHLIHWYITKFRRYWFQQHTFPVDSLPPLISVLSSP